MASCFQDSVAYTFILCPLLCEELFECIQPWIQNLSASTQKTELQIGLNNVVSTHLAGSLREKLSGYISWALMFSRTLILFLFIFTH